MNKLFAVTTAIVAFAAAQAHAAPISASYYSSFTDTGSGIVFDGTPYFSETMDDINIDFNRTGGPAGRPTSGDVFAADFTGQFLIASDGTYDFTFGSDDAGYLFIDGANVASRPGANSYGTTPFPATLTAGLHSFEVQYDNLFCCGAQIGLTFDPAVVVVQPSAVPEPASWALMLGGIALAGGALRRAYRRSEDDFTAKVREAAQA